MSIQTGEGDPGIITGFSPETGAKVEPRSAVELGGNAVGKVVAVERKVTVVDMSDRTVSLTPEQVADMTPRGHYDLGDRYYPPTKPGTETTQES